MDRVQGFQRSINILDLTVAVSSESSKTVAHNLGYKPPVWFEDASGNVQAIAPSHTDENSFTVTFAGSTTGTLHYG